MRALPPSRAKSCSLQVCKITAVAHTLLSRFNVHPTPHDAIVFLTSLLPRTGGSSGIGLATVKLMLSLGAFVVAGDINEPPVPPTEHLSFQRTDVTSWKDLSALFKKAKALHGRIDHVFANAGISTRVNYLEQDVDENGDLLEPSFQVIDVNLRGVLNTATLALYYLRPERQEGGGSIVLTASSTSKRLQNFRPLFLQNVGALGYR